MNDDLESKLRATFAENAARIQPRPFNKRWSTTANRRRMVRIVAAGTGTLALLSAVGLGAPTMTRQFEKSKDGFLAADNPENNRLASISRISPSPLSPRRDTSSVWTGSEFIIWGGSQNIKASDAYLKDGAAYNPATKSWRRLSAAPLSSRSGAQAAWTGREMVIWGGVGSARGPQGLVDGAAYNPKSDTWRRIAPAPGKGRWGAKTIVMAGKVVTIGGRNPEGITAASTILIFDPNNSTWKVVSAAHTVYDAAPVNGGITLVELDDQGILYTEKLSANETMTAGTQPRPSSVRVGQVGITVHNSTVYILTQDGTAEKTELFTSSVTNGQMPGSWKITPVSKPVDAPIGVDSIGNRGSLVALSTGSLLAIALPNISVIDPENGIVNMRDSTLKRSNICGANAAIVWTGTELLSWGGEGCRANGSAVTNQGISWHQ